MSGNKNTIHRLLSTRTPFNGGPLYLFLFIWACPLHQSTTNATSAIARVDLLLKFLLQSVMTFGWAGFHEFMNSNVVGICWSSVALEELDSFKSEPSLLNLECCFLGRGVTAPPPESFTVTFFGFKQIYKRGRALSSTDATLNVGRVPIAWEPQKAEREEIGTTVCISIYFDADVCGMFYLPARRIDTECSPKSYTHVRAPDLFCRQIF